MASIEELARQKVRIYEQAPETLANEATRLQEKLWRQLLPVISELQTDSDGNITQSDANIRRISVIIRSLNELLAGDEYKSAIRNFLGEIDKNVVLTDEIAKQIDKGFSPDNTQKQILNLVKSNAIDALIGDGLRGRVSQPFAQQLIANIASRAPLREAVKSLEQVIVGDDKTDGRIAASVKTIAVTAQSIADRSYSAAVYEQLGVEYFRYIGGEIKTTRPFCRHRVSEVFHKKEIEAWGNGQNSGGLNDIKDGTWAGRKDGTNGKTIFVNLGGWECRHSLAPVTGSRVPESVRQRAKAEGYTK